MKKAKLSFLLTLIGFCALGISSCGKKQYVDILFPSQEGIVFVTDDLKNGQAVVGTELSFTLDLSAWNGSKNTNIKMLANGQEISRSESGEYSFVVTGQTTLSFADVTVTFNEIDGVEYISEYDQSVTVPFNTDISFALDISPFYTAESAIVRAGSRTASPNDDGIYVVRATSDMQINVLDVVEVQPSCTTGGTSSEDPFWIYTPADWKFIAEQVNAGNPNYVNGYYQMAADLDFQGETIPVIGDASDVGGVQTYFGGYFNGMGYSISNFKIETNGKPYVGPFGYVVADLEDANFGIILDLKVKDFTISAVMNRDGADMLACGGIIGYGIGANILNCSVENANIEITGNDYYSSFVGGAVGVLQTAYLDFGDFESRVSSQVAYVSVTNANIYALSGIIPAAGGVVGYTYAPDYLSTASLINCYANNVFTYGAIHTGGVVGQLGAYSSVFNSYATGNVTANTNINDLVNMPDYCYAYAGGIVGYAENETAVVNCFSTAALDSSAKLGKSYQVINGTIAKADSANTHNAGAIPVYTRNNYYANGGKDGDLDLTNPDFIFKELNWYDFDWEYKDGASYPVFNYNSSYEDGFAVTAVYSGATVNGKNDYFVAFENYAPLSFAYVSDQVALSEFTYGDNGKISYGLFFDQECTQRVPYSYLFAAQKETFYVGFISYDEVAGEYEMKVSSGDTASLVLNNDGSYQYEDGGITTGGLYRYNGEYIVFENARFARYANGGNVNSDIYMLDFYSFRADIKDGDLYIYDGVYFTEDKPLVALSSFGFEGEYFFSNNTYVFGKDWTVKINNQTYTYTLSGSTLKISNGATGTYNNGKVVLSGSTLKKADDFKGEWIVSAAENYKLILDGKGGWTMETFGYDKTEYYPTYETYTTKKGSYTISGTKATLTETTGGKTYSVALDADGYLCMTGSGIDLTFSRANGYSGEWLAITNYGDVLLRLNGITIDGSGMGEIEYWDGNVYSLFYAMEYGRITLYNDIIVFGYMSYNARTDTLEAYLYDSNQSIIDETYTYTFYHYDAFLGEWVGEFDAFGTIDFNGFGSYNVGLIGMEGRLTINGEEFDYSLNADSLSGSFAYDGVSYSISYNPSTGVLTISSGSTSKDYERKDIYADAEIVDLNGSTYAFDGRGNLVSGGQLIVTTKDGVSTTYKYTISGTQTKVFKGSTQYATIKVVGNTYVWTAGGKDTKLYTNNLFVGTWAVGGSYTTISISPMNTIGEMQVEKDGIASIAVYNKETGICTYENQYLIPLTNGGFAISNTEVLGTDYSVCMTADELFGTQWTKKGFTASANSTYEFDGLGLSETSGSAKRLYGGSATLYTYEYLAEYGTYRMYDGSNSIMIIEFCEVGTSGAYVSADGTRAFLLSNIDELYMAEAIEEATGYTYTFDGKYTYSSKDGGTPGTVTVTDADGNVVTTYKYLLTKRMSALFKIEMTLTAEDGTVYNAVFSYGANPFTITLEKK